MKVLAVLLVLLVGGVVVADRVGEGIAEDRVAERIAARAGLTGTPEVDIAGFPFLTQALAGRYSDVRVSLTGEQLGQPPGTRADISLRGVQLPLSDALSGASVDIPVERVDGTATLSYDLLADSLGGDTTLEPADGGVLVTRTVQLLGTEVPVTANGTVTIDGTELVVDVDQATAAGVDVPDFVLDRAVELLGFRYAVPELPLGLQLTGVVVEPDGIHVRAEATDTVLPG